MVSLWPIPLYKFGIPFSVIFVQLFKKFLKKGRRGGFLPGKINFEVGKFGELSCDMMRKELDPFISNFLTAKMPGIRKNSAKSIR